MKEDIKKELEEEKKEEEEVKEEEAKEEDNAEEEKEIEKLVSKITKSITSELSAHNKASKDAEAKKKALNSPSTASYVDKEVKVHTKKDGTHILMRTSEMELCSDWFKAFLNKDSKICNDIVTKLEPLQEGTNALGGFLVPTILANFITEVKEDASVIRPRSNVIDMSGMKTNQLDITGIASKPRVSWTSELAVKSTSSVNFNQISLTPYKMTAIVTMSTELRDDSPFNVIQLVGRLLGEAVAREEDRVFLNGNGTGQPTGIDNYAFANTVNAGGALNFDHIIRCFYNLPQAYRSNGYWIANSRTIAVIRHLKTTTNDYVLRDHGFITEPTMPSMLGRPVLENNNATSDRVFFGDLKNYHIADKGGVKLDTSEEAVVGTYNLWERNMIGIKVEERVDAELAPTQSFTEVQNTGVS